MKNFEDMGILEMCKTIGEMGDALKAKIEKKKVWPYGSCHGCEAEPQYHNLKTCDCYCHTRD